MKPIIVLVVDDSAFMRKVICEMLSAEDGFLAVSARDGYDALQKINRLKPDVVTLDVEMPGMNGLDVLKSIMAKFPLPVIMLSSHTQRGSSITMEALSLGAIDFVEKPALNQGIERVKEELTRKIRTAIQSENILGQQRPLQDLRRRERPQNIGQFKFKQCSLVAMGASTGGPSALEKVLVKLPAEFPVPIIITQHMPAGFTKAFADRLNNLCKIEVKEAAKGDQMKKGAALIAPGGYHMVVSSEGYVTLNQDPPVEHVRPAVNVMLDSAIKIYGSKIIGVILTGMGKDGADSMESLKKRGGKTIVQDQSTSVIFSMPKSVIDRGAADVIAPIQDIGGILTQALMP